MAENTPMPRKGQTRLVNTFDSAHLACKDGKEGFPESTVLSA